MTLSRLKKSAFLLLSLSTGLFLGACAHQQPNPQRTVESLPSTANPYSYSLEADCSSEDSCIGSTDENGERQLECTGQSCVITTRYESGERKVSCNGGARCQQKLKAAIEASQEKWKSLELTSYQCVHSNWALESAPTPVTNSELLSVEGSEIKRVEALDDNGDPAGDVNASHLRYTTATQLPSTCLKAIVHNKDFESLDLVFDKAGILSDCYGENEEGYFEDFNCKLKR